MKHINKYKIEPSEFTDWKNSNPMGTFKNLNATPEKEILKKALIEEQKSLCCYCESLITANDSHIEHFKPKGGGQFPEEQLVYANLHASCIKRPTGSTLEHCGHRKGNYFSANLISPLEQDCQNHFSYYLDGTIHDRDARGKETIETLQLDSALLDAKRKSLILSFEELDDNDRIEQLEEHLDQSKIMLGEFYTMIAYLKDEIR